jgi:hypothetical protein
MSIDRLCGACFVCVCVCVCARSRNEQYDFESAASFFKWLESSELFTPMNDTDAEGFLDFGMVHFNKVDVYLVMIE